MPNTHTPTMFVTQASPTRRHIYITQSSSRQRAMASQPSPAAEESPLIAACRRYAQQHGALGKRADADTAADTSGQGDADDQESPLVRAARKRAEEARKHQKAQQR